jgi:branched-chain amino acid transport system ATP-binding protein
VAAEPIVEARELHAWYGSSHVLHGVDLAIGRGETLGLLGRNGMGKSTLIRTLLGHVARREGRITLFGRDATRARPHEVARLGVAYVPEGRGVFPNLGGEQQMLAIGRALMTHPELIILDEATEGLAPLIVAEIWRVIGEIRAGGIASLIVDRDWRRVLAHSDRALVLQKGRAVLHGDAAVVARSAELAGYLGV